MAKKPTVLMILDGFGLNENPKMNAVAQAKTPVIDHLMATCPFVKGYASGLAVGLPDGQMGNSEVGHLNMGAGRIVYQELTRITKSIEDGDFFENPALLAAVENCKKNDSALHLWGLVSDGGVHSHITHIYGLLELAKRNGLEKVYIHAFLDGRDTPPESGADYVQALVYKCNELGVGRVVMVSGRYYAMDRDKNYDREEKAYRALRYGEGIEASDPVQAIRDSYANGVSDEFVVPAVVYEDGKPVGTVQDKDSVIFFNFRPDRAREMTHIFCDDEFTYFDRGPARPDVCYVCFTDYDVTIPNKLVAFVKEELNETFGQYLAEHGLKQARIAETEKYAHVTFFFNGGVEKQYPGEDRVLIPSPREFATYDLVPKMSAEKVRDALCEKMRTGEYDVVICNFANCDMVGHTGVMQAAIEAVECVDQCLGEICKTAGEMGYKMLITADHGNADRMVEPDGSVNTAHTTNLVPMVLFGDHSALRPLGKLADLAPTMLELMGIEQPKEMTGESLILHNE